MTVKNRALKITANEENKNFTIETFINGEASTTYGTIEMNREEFEDCKYMTANDWKYFLRSTEDYYKVN